MTSTAADAVPDQRFLAQIVDLERYPLGNPGSPAWERAVAAARQALRASGCCVLRGFVPAGRRNAVRRECLFVAGQARSCERAVNVYHTEPDPCLPPDHPARRTMVRGGAFVARDVIPAAFLIHRLYDSPPLLSFLAACLEVPAVCPFGDRLASLVVNVLPPGKEHPWHFDTSEFAATLVTQAPDGGGTFEYCPAIRSAQDENLDGVTAVLDGHAGNRVRRLWLRAGDLYLLRGRYSMHRVSPVSGETPRYSVSYSYKSLD